MHCSHPLALSIKQLLITFYWSESCYWPTFLFKEEWEGGGNLLSTIETALKSWLVFCSFFPSKSISDQGFLYVSLTAYSTLTLISTYLLFQQSVSCKAFFSDLSCPWGHSSVSSLWLHRLNFLEIEPEAGVLMRLIYWRSYLQAKPTQGTMGHSVRKNSNPTIVVF